MQVPWGKTSIFLSPLGSLKFWDFLSFLFILKLSCSKPIRNILNCASTANIEEVMKVYNLGDNGRFWTLTLSLVPKFKSNCKDLGRLSCHGRRHWFLLDTVTWAVSSQGIRDHFGAKSANWLASCQNCQSRFQFHKTYSMFHVTWTTFKFNRKQLGTVLAYVRWLWLITLSMYTLKWLSIIEPCRTLERGWKVYHE